MKNRIYCINFSMDEQPYKSSYMVEEDAEIHVLSKRLHFLNLNLGIYATARERNKALKIIKNALNGKFED